MDLSTTDPDTVKNIGGYPYGYPPLDSSTCGFYLCGLPANSHVFNCIYWLQPSPLPCHHCTAAVVTSHHCCCPAATAGARAVIAPPLLLLPLLHYCYGCLLLMSSTTPLQQSLLPLRHLGCSLFTMISAVAVVAESAISVEKGRSLVPIAASVTPRAARVASLLSGQ